MQLFCNALVVYLIEIIILSCVINSSFGRRFENYFPGGYYNAHEHDNKVKLALENLEHAPQWVPNWPETSLQLGQVAGLALDNSGNLVVFHRGPNVWDMNSFNSREVYQNIGEPPISQPTIIVFNETGDIVDMWGQNLFHMPHGITVDMQGNVWVTDVAMHQVFKFTPQQRQIPALVLGEKFVPRDDDTHFCKPSAVAVLSSGDFFVADGYCNTRIIKYRPDGTKILQWGRHAGSSPFVFRVPHALTLAEERGLVCVADRERGRAACFRHDNGTYVTGFSSWLIGERLFSLAYAPVKGGRLYVVNGPTNSEVPVPVRGYVIDFSSGKLIQTFAPEGNFANPHDIVASADGSRVYVAEINPYKVHKFVDDSLKNESRKEVQRSKIDNLTVPVKPTATIEITNRTVGSEAGGDAWAWRGALGAGGALALAAAAALAAALLALAALALLRARNNGRKSVPRRRWEYGGGEFKLRRLLERRGGCGARGRGGRFTRVHSDDSDDEPAPMLPPQPPANA